ncbi:hypothetical protein PYCCODRAFT_1458951 [Trametes coccinea BRFM310]|uniref:Uncharacterized protein n=1 Tax=Trametes coccinea (strain BRFM310) TaxID=1353009 RepID=A0A1Y2IRQ6_TRAC3|nr:hypothetical protein PYCCODRAFT_1458951 [Trametes coccinea BRFM310]
MGSAASKPARKLARTPPAWAGARTPNVGEQAPARPVVPQASETKSEAIENDSKDPHFLANLNKLGQVKVDHHMQTVRPAADQAQRLFQARLRSEDQARSSRPPRNHLLAASLLDLLEERKYASKPQDLQETAKKYDMDVEKLERLARHVNSVSVDQDTVKRWIDDEGVEHVTMMATWVNPKVEVEKPLLGSS